MLYAICLDDVRMETDLDPDGDLSEKPLPCLNICQELGFEGLYGDGEVILGAVNAEMDDPKAPKEGLHDLIAVGDYQGRRHGILLAERFLGSPQLRRSPWSL